MWQAMIRTTMDMRPEKRARKQFIWHRFVSKRDPPVVLLMREHPRIEVMAKLVEEDRIPVAQRGYFDRWMEDVRKGEKNPKALEVKYMQTEPEIRALASMNYGGSRYLGRLFARTSMGSGCTRGQDVKREVRNTLYHETHVDVDIVNAQPTIISQVLSHMDIPTLKYYVDNRDSVFTAMERIEVKSCDGVVSYEQLDRKTVKQLVNAILNGSKRKNLQPSFVREMQFFKDLCMEVQEMFEEVATEYGTLRGILQRQCQGYHDGKLMALLYRDIEQAILVTMVECIGEICQTSGERSDNMILMHDGLLVPKGLAEDANLLYKLQEAVKDHHDLSIQLKIKPMEPFYESCLDIPACDQDAGVSYEEWKLEFDKTHFRIRSPCAFVRINPYGKRDYYSLAKFRDEVCVDDNKEYVKQWLSDKNARVYEMEVFIPPPATTTDDMYNTYTGLRAEQLDPVPDEEVDGLIERVLYHMRVLTGLKDETRDQYEWLLKLLAWRVVNPGILPKVAIGFRSEQGTGKDSFFAFFGEMLLGKDYTSQQAEVSDVFTDTFTTSRKDKLLMIFSECVRANTIKQEAKLKDLVTSETQTYRAMHVAPFVKNHYALVVMFAQNIEFVKVDQDDRRYVIFDVSPRYARSHDYFKPLIEDFHSDRVARAFYQYLTNHVDIKGFLPSNTCDMPSTRAKEAMKEYNVQPVPLFMKVYVQKEAARQLHDIREYLGDHIIECRMRDLRNCFKMWLESSDVYTYNVMFPKFKSDLGALMADSQYTADDGSIRDAIKFKKVNGRRRIYIVVKPALDYLERITNGVDYDDEES